MDFLTVVMVNKCSPVILGINDNPPLFILSADIGPLNRQKITLRK